MVARPVILACVTLLLHIAVVNGALAYYYPSLEYQVTRNNSHNLSQGWRVYGDRILHRELVKRSYKLFQVVTADLRYPSLGYTNATITQVLALDQVTDGTGGYANITRGGAGLHEVVMRFKSQRNHSFSFIIEIYGRDVIASSVYMSVYNGCIEGQPGSKNLFMIMVAGGFAGIISWGVIIPLDVIKSRIQSDDPLNPKYKGTLDCFIKSYRHDGLAVFGRGFLVNTLRAFPVNGAIFVGFEWSYSMCKNISEGLALQN
uniref:Mitochondrial carrier protein n=1 Tax=Timema bartmani TaxID=61472 RepID=A0A7R9EQF3_9NEOP|nr:unnamed protein product [Timema bartmani]